MKLLHQMNKNSLLVLLASSVLITSTLVACGGAKDEASGSVAAIDNGLPAYKLDGFIQCGAEFEGDITLSVDTHVAYGSIEDYRLIYLFNQKKGTVIKPSNETFGGDPLPSVTNRVYCKPVTNDNNELAVFDASLLAVQSHLDSMYAKDKKFIQSSEQLQLHAIRLKQTMYAIAKSETTLLQAFDVITAYEKVRGGALFFNQETKNGFPNENYADLGRDIDRAVLTIQQGIHDIAFSPVNVMKYKNILAGKSFNSHAWFPGKVKNNVKADSTKIHEVNINATMVADTDTPSAFSRSAARRPTGYYLAAGDIAKVTVPQSMVNSKEKFVIQVGANVHDKTVKSTIARPYRVDNKFPIVSTVTEIANPNGGGIYIDVPYLSAAGNNVKITIQNAVPAPFFSFTALKKMSNEQWQNTQRNNPAPWADFVSDKFMMTLPTSWIYNYADPVALMEDWDKKMDVVSDLVGRNRVRNNQILYLTVDTNLQGNAYGIAYPTGNNTYNPGEPTDGNNKNWYLIPGKDFWDTEFHELGHAQLFSNFPGEGEASVNLLSAAVSNKLYGVDIDTALGKSMANRLHIGRPEAAINWMVTPNFRAGKAMDITHSTTDEVQYQQRGYAKYVEVAALFGWDKLEKFYLEENRAFRQEVVAAGAGLSGVDSRILRMSISAGVDLTPLIHFWGVQPVEAAKLSAAITAANLKPSLAIYNRLKVYQGIIPMDNASFKVHAAKFLDKPANLINGDNKSPDYAEGWYAVWLNKYSLAEGQAAQAAFDKIFARYFPAGKPV
jgi:Peptidase M60, enhancin and enhancin-like/N-terminal domain of M60-like peptidases